MTSGTPVADNGVYEESFSCREMKSERFSKAF
jgi:hypothetical protein